MISLLDLPLELLLEITALVLDDNTCPSHFLRANKLFHKLGLPLLHSHLTFRSVNQLVLFAREEAPLTCLPKSIVVALAGGFADFDVFRHLAAAIQRCRSAVQGSDLAERGVQLPLELMSLCLHSHSRNPNQQFIYEALTQTK